MGFFEDFNNFLETKLEEFLSSNPHLELEALSYELAEEKNNTVKLINELNNARKNLDEEIVTIAKDIQLWHGRIEKAKALNELELANQAQQRENDLLRLGNLVWTKRGNIEKNLKDSQQLLSSLEKRQAEVKIKIDQVKANQVYSNTYNNRYNDFDSSQTVNSYYKKGQYDALDAKFQKLETEEELQKIKQNLNL